MLKTEDLVQVANIEKQSIANKNKKSLTFFLTTSDKRAILYYNIK
jgi:hypothetical protein